MFDLYKPETPRKYSYLRATSPWPPSLVDLQEMIIVSWDNNDMHGCPFRRPWLVVCSGMLLIVDYYLSVTSSGAPVNYKAYLLDMSTEPATWLEVVKLENDTAFIARVMGGARSLLLELRTMGREKQLPVRCP